MLLLFLCATISPNAVANQQSRTVTTFYSNNIVIQAGNTAHFVSAKAKWLKHKKKVDGDKYANWNLHCMIVGIASLALMFLGFSLSVPFAFLVIALSVVAAIFSIT
ncbi:MAG: hypothetical protein IPL65_08065 [Lewinellaceae bacterium]|nr:hypothetical protein [Lewinellaceae bacterium]